jgi:hypothetical protein
MNCPAALCAASPSPLNLPWQETDPFAFDILGIALLHLAGQTLVLGAAAVLLDAGLLQKLKMRSKRCGKLGTQTARMGQAVPQAAGDSCGAAQGEEAARSQCDADSKGLKDAVVSCCCFASTSR